MTQYTRDTFKNASTVPLCCQTLDHTVLTAPDDVTPQVLRVVKTARDAATDPDAAYTILGVAADTAAAAIRKRYMKLSIMIHPDKFQHPMAKDAFQVQCNRIFQSRNCCC